ncbi:MAG: biotin/lipoyl-containing protein [Bradymonadia bacterium]
MRYTIEGPEGPVDVQLSAHPEGGHLIQIGDAPPKHAHVHVGATEIHVVIGHRSLALRRGARGDRTHVTCEGFDQVVQVVDPKTMRRRLATGAGGSSGEQLISSPMPGKVVAVLVEPGQTVEAGQGVVIVEAMKMENELRAEEAGVVISVEVSAGDLVEGQAKLVRIGPMGSDDDDAPADSPAS